VGAAGVGAGRCCSRNPGAENDSSAGQYFCDQLVVLIVHLSLLSFEMKRLMLGTTLRVRSAGGALGNPYAPLTATIAILTMFGAPEWVHQHCHEISVHSRL
jgi:hypothetical protein